MSIDSKYLEACIESADFDIAAPDRSLPKIIERGLIENIALVYEKAAGGAFDKGLLYLRACPDWKVAKDCFELSSSQGIKLLKYTQEQAPRRHWDFFSALMSAIEAKNKSHAKVLAEGIQAIIRPEKDLKDNWQYGFAMCFSALVLNDSEQFHKIRSFVNEHVEKPKRGISWWHRHDCYWNAIDAVFLNDNILLAQCLEDCIDKFDARATEKGMDDAALEDGGNKDNEYVPDYMALAILILARQRGMPIRVDRSALPFKYVEFLEKLN